MTSLQITTALLGIGLAAIILFLVRRDHMYVMHGMFWIVVAFAAALLGLWPRLVDRLASLAGISYPPALLLLGVSIVLFIKALHTDMVNTRIERSLRLLNQRLAIFELERTEALNLAQSARSEPDELPPDSSRP
jgi:hypothetical protein